MIRPLLLLVSGAALLLAPTAACPTNQTLYLFCRCESSYSGINLDCSGSNADTTLTVLRDNQAQLGLIQQLTMSNASMSVLPPRFLKGLYVKKLDLSHNLIAQIHDDAFDGLENIIQQLDLQFNRLTTLPADALSGLSTLLELNLSNNSIGNLNNKHALRNIPKLYDLNLGSNKICDVQKGVFESVKHSVQTLNLGANCLSRVPASAIRGFKRLLALHLHDNGIGELEPLEFMNMPMLNLLNLARNRISKLHRQAFLNVPNLRLLYLSDNAIAELQPQQFSHFETLEMLDLTRNRLSALPSRAFANMSRLSQLYLGENRIARLHADAFANSSIALLLLPDNELSAVDSDSFASMPYLQQFSLKNNRIKQIDANAFHQMPNLVMLDLSHNELSSLPPATFLSQLNMFLIDLSNNRLLVTPYNAFNKRIMTVVLQENPLVCTERVHMLQNGVGVYVPGTIDVICGDAPPSTTADPDEEPSFLQETASTRVKSIIQPASAVDAAHLPPAANVTTIYRPVVTLSPDFFTRKTSAPARIPIAQTSAYPFVTAATAPPRPQPFAPTIGIPSAFDPRRPDTQRPLNPLPPQFPQLPIPKPTEASPAFEATTTVYERPRTVHPFPVPFLSRGPHIAPAYFATTSTPRPSLPPGIIFATAHPPHAALPEWTSPRFETVAPWQPTAVLTRPTQRPWQDNAVLTQPTERPWQDTAALTRPTEPPWHETFPGLPPRVSLPENDVDLQGVPVVTSTQPADVRTLAPTTGAFGLGSNELDDGAQYPFDLDAAARDQHRGATAKDATTTIVVCVAVVVIVMAGVFVTLCVVRHRTNTGSRRHQLSSSSGSSDAAARTQAYVAAQAAAHATYAAPSHYATASLARSALATAPQQRAAAHGHASWLYAPGSYASAANYYK